MLQAFTPAAETTVHEATIDDQLLHYLAAPDLSPLCRYAGKPCTTPRAMKRNGSLHSLCDRHRMRANNNQRRMTKRRRANEARIQAILHPHLGRPSVDIPASWTASDLYTYAPSAYSAALTVDVYEPKSLLSPMFADPRSLDVFPGAAQSDLLNYTHSDLTFNTPALDESYFMDVSGRLEPVPAPMAMPLELELGAPIRHVTGAQTEQPRQLTETVDLSAYIAPAHVRTGYHQTYHNYHHHRRQQQHELLKL